MMMMMMMTTRIQLCCWNLKREFWYPTRKKSNQQSKFLILQQCRRIKQLMKFTYLLEYLTNSQFIFRSFFFVGVTNMFSRWARTNNNNNKKKRAPCPACSVIWLSTKIQPSRLFCAQQSRHLDMKKKDVYQKTQG